MKSAVPSSVTSPAEPLTRLLRDVIRSPIIAFVTVALCLWALTFALDPDGSLGTDTGGKLATVHVMVERDDWSPDLGYWAEDLDPDGSLHPFFGMRNTDAGWVNVTSLPMILFGRLVVGFFGPRAIFLFPIAGTVLAAAGAARLSRLFGANSWRPAFWTVSLGSPLTVYALDFWEHSMGVGLMMWGICSVVNSHRSKGHQAMTFALLAGVLFGAAGTMRQEAYIVGLVGGMIVGLGGHSVGLLRPVRFGPGISMLGGAVVSFGLNSLLEQAIIGADSRTGRAAGVLTSGGRNLPLRLQEAVITISGPIGQIHPLSIVMALLVAVGLVWLAGAAMGGSALERPLAIVGSLILLVFIQVVVFGPGFVPGLLAACPLAALGLAVCYRRRMYIALILALTPVPLVLWFQYFGAALAQWGGRYLLTSGIVLSAAAISQFDLGSRLLRGFLLGNFVLAGLGVAMLVTRTQSFGSAHRDLAARTEPVLIFADPFLAREAAPIGWNEQWLTAFSDADKQEAAELLESRGIPRFAYLGFPDQPDPTFPGYSISTTDVVSYGSFEMELWSFKASPEG